MASTPKSNNALILEQFSLQAELFSKAAPMANEDLTRLVLAKAQVSADDIALDVACGPGIITCAVAQVAAQVSGIDLAPAMIEQAKARQQRLGLTNMHWYVDDVLALPFADASFSLVITRFSFHHFPDPAAVLAEMIRICASGGRIVVVDIVTVTPGQAATLNHYEKLRDPSHARALSLPECEALFRHPSLSNAQTVLTRLPMEMEGQLARSFPLPGDEAKLRALLREDIGRNQLGMDVCERDGSLHYHYPVAVLTARKT